MLYAALYVCVFVCLLDVHENFAIYVSSKSPLNFEIILIWIRIWEFLEKFLPLWDRIEGLEIQQILLITKAVVE